MQDDHFSIQYFTSPFFFYKGRIYFSYSSLFDNSSIVEIDVVGASKSMARRGGTPTLCRWVGIDREMDVALRPQRIRGGASSVPSPPSSSCTMMMAPPFSRVSGTGLQWAGKATNVGKENATCAKITIGKRFLALTVTTELPRYESLGDLVSNSVGAGFWLKISIPSFHGKYVVGVALIYTCHQLIILISKRGPIGRDDNKQITGSPYIRATSVVNHYKIYFSSQIF